MAKNVVVEDVCEGLGDAAMAGSFMKAARTATGLSQRDFAKRLGTSQNIISFMENGRGKYGPTYAILRRAARVSGGRLKISIEYGPGD